MQNAPIAQQYLVASDIGGTFTDTVVLDEAGTVHRYKADRAGEPG
jgi:N-methylhydantoinase A/oxoprolinase/acetone carboxylase beta subunit